MEFLDNRYRYRPNGDIMIIIHCEALNRIFNQDYSVEKMCEKVKVGSQSDEIRNQLTHIYTRNKYVSEYAKHHFMIMREDRILKLIILFDWQMEERIQRIMLLHCVRTVIGKCIL